jgi:hypothetical protein
MKTASMVIAILAGFFGLPASVCAGACAAGLSAVGDASRSDANAAGNAFMFFGVIASILAIAGGILINRPGKIGVFLQAIALALAILTCLTLNPMSMFFAFLLMLSTIFAVLGKKNTST